uniref:Uncharacterized protein n=1 Tax=Caenorhabditis japonica TaxID=281687 RepID=A0A8R1I8Z1_CAEJA
MLPGPALQENQRPHWHYAKRRIRQSNGGDSEGDLKNFLKCYPTKPLLMSKLWKDPVAAATALGLAVKPFDSEGDTDP